MKKTTLLTLLLIAFTGFTSLAQDTVYVSATGAGNMDGTSESTAFGNFGVAMSNITSEGDKLIIVGTITPDGANLTSKNFAFTIEGLNTSSTLAGNGGTGRLFTINGSTSVDVTFKNLTFSNNNTTLAGGSVFFSNAAGATVTFNNCILTGNSVSNGAGGGAIFFANGTLNIIDSLFENNSSIEEAGAIFGQSGTILITNSIFDANEVTTRGGAIYNANANLTITDCVFENNISLNNGGAIVAASSGNLTVSGSLFNGNSGNRGGAIAVLSTNSDFVMSNSTFVNNSATLDGGAMYLGGANANSSITNTTVFGNTVTNATLNQSKGAGIRMEGVRPFTIQNSLIYGNLVTNDTETAGSDIGIVPNTVLNLSHSITKIIEPALDDTAGDDFSTSIVGADLTSSNLMFMNSSGYVEYDAVSSSEDSPIDFGSDGNDAGSWNSGLALSLNKQDVLAANVLVFQNKASNSIEISHTISTPLTVEVYSILGTKLLGLKNVAQRQSIQANSLASGIYILKGESSGKSFSKKFIIN